jgi:hypothetical protein
MMPVKKGWRKLTGDPFLIPPCRRREPEAPEPFNLQLLDLPDIWMKFRKQVCGNG